MPYTLKKNKFKYKNPDTGNYEGVDVVAERSFADYQSALENVGLEQQTAVTAAGTAAAANFPATAEACDTLAGDFAATYVPDQAYTIGDYCTYQYQLYQCKTAIAVNTDHTFVTSHWNLITVTDTINDQVDDLKTQLTEAENEIDTKASSASLSSEITRAQSEEARIEALFSAPTQEAINKWFADNPDAWIAVQDNSISEAKFTDLLKTKAIKDYLTPQMFGAKGDGVTDDYIAITNCISAAQSDNKIVVFPKVANGYKISDRIIISGRVDVLMYSPVISTGDAIVVGTSNVRTREHIYVLKATGNGSGDGIKFINVTASNISVDCSKFENGVVFLGDTLGFSYNKVNLGLIMDCEYCVTLTNDNGGWCNENIFINGKLGKYSGYSKTCCGILITSRKNYSNNNNVFLKPCVEGCDKGFRFEYSQRTSVLFARTEAVAEAFYFSSNSSNHMIYVGYGKTQSEDYGVNNVVFNYSKYSKIAYCEKIFDSGDISEYSFSSGTGHHTMGKYISSVLNDGTASQRTFIRHPGYIEAKPGNSYGVMLDAAYCKSFRLSCTTKDNTGHRYVVKMFDADGAEITTGLMYDSAFGGIYSYNDNGIRSGVGAFMTTADNVFDTIITVPASCKKVFLGVKKGTGDFYFKNIVVYGASPAFVYPSGLSSGIGALPDCEGTEGDICPSSGSNTGWRYHNGAWESF